MEWWILYAIGYIICTIWSKEPVGSLLWPIFLIVFPIWDWLRKYWLW